MVATTRAVKISLAASLLSLLIYVLYQALGGYVILFEYLNNVPSAVHYVTFLGPAFWASTVGITARFLGCLLGLVILGLLWMKSQSFLQVRRIVVAALILESLNFIALIPDTWALLDSQSFIHNVPLGVGYLLQICFTVPFLWLLAYHVAVYQQSSQKMTLLKFGALAFVGYTVALTANEVSRWTSMISMESLHFIEGIEAVGFYNALVLMPFSIVFALLGTYRLFQRNERPAMRWLGVSLAVIGLNYTIYLFYSYLVNALNTLPLVDIWTIPLLALGVALILNAQNSVGFDKS